MLMICCFLTMNRTIAGVPVIALFTLFELVIFNPKHTETRGNLALLDVAGGYFSRLEYASNGSLPSSLVSEFAYIAREYVNNIHKPDAASGQVQPQKHRRHRQPSASAAAMTLGSATPGPLVGVNNNNTTTKNQEQQQQQQQQQSAILQDMNNNNNNNTGMEPLMSSFAPPPLTHEGTGMVPPGQGMDSSPGSVSMDGINFPIMDTGAFGGIPGHDFLLGTDVMDLFNYSVSGIDPFYMQTFDAHEQQQQHPMGS